MSTYRPRWTSRERQLEAMAGQAVAVYLRVERGLAPVSLLAKIALPQVVERLGPIKPPKPGAMHALSVQRVHLGVVGDDLIHVAAVVPRLDGRPGALVMRLRKDQPTRQWRIEDVRRPEEGEHTRQREHDDEDAAPRPPIPDVSRLIRRIEAERDAARERLRLARAELTEARMAYEKQPTGTTRQWTDRRAARELADQRRAETERLQGHIRTLHQELHDLEVIAELRDLRHAVLTGDPPLAPGPKPHLEQLLGPLPTSLDARREWRRQASLIERTRRRPSE